MKANMAGLSACTWNESKTRVQRLSVSRGVMVMEARRGTGIGI